MGGLAYKIGSGECNNTPLVDHITSFAKPVLVSTGMNDLASIARTVQPLRRAQRAVLYYGPRSAAQLGELIGKRGRAPDKLVVPPLQVRPETTQVYAYSGFSGTRLRSTVIILYVVERPTEADMPAMELFNSYLQSRTNALFELADVLGEQLLVEALERIGKIGDHGQALLRHFGEAAEHDDALRAVGHMHRQNARPQRGDQRGMLFQHAEVTLDARHVDLLDAAREQQLFRRDQFEMQRHC
jgi:hypothetical protein